MKLSFWTELPYLILGMNHFAESTARSIAKQCLRQWEDMEHRLAVVADHGGNQGARMHPLAALYFHRDSDLRALVLKFAQGASREDPELKPLVKHLAGLRCIPIVSRAIEGRHSVLKRLLSRAPNSTASCLSLALRLPEMIEALTTDPELVKGISKLLDLCRKPRHVVAHLGLASHRACVPGGAISCRLAKNIIYRQDKETQYMTIPVVFRRRNQGQGIPQIPADSPDNAPQDAVRILQHFAREHFGAVCDRSNWFLAVVKPPVGNIVNHSAGDVKM